MNFFKPFLLEVAGRLVGWQRAQTPPPRLRRRRRSRDGDVRDKGRPGGGGGILRDEKGDV